MTAHRPTRMCPHRLCRPTHMALGVVGIAFIAQILFSGLLNIIFVAALGVIGLAVARLIHQKTLHQQILDDATDEAADTVLTVRERWALAAIVFDLLLLVASTAAVSLLFTTHEVSVPSADASGYFALSFGIGLTAATEYAHRQATRPGRPKRVTKLAASEA